MVKALFKVVLDDTEYEISVRSDYLDFLKSEIKRMQEAYKYYEKMEKASNPDKKEYFRQSAKYCLNSGEEVDKIPIILEELKKAYNVRKAHIDKLYDEVKQIKKLRV